MGSPFEGTLSRENIPLMQESFLFLQGDIPTHANSYLSDLLFRTRAFFMFWLANHPICTSHPSGLTVLTISEGPLSLYRDPENHRFHAMSNMCHKPCGYKPTLDKLMA